MGSQFTVEERKKSLLRRHLKEHAFEYILDMIVTVLFAVLLLYLCRAQDILLGIALAFFFSLGKVIQQISQYKKEYIDVDIKE